MPDRRTQSQLRRRVSICRGAWPQQHECQKRQADKRTREEEGGARAVLIQDEPKQQRCRRARENGRHIHCGPSGPDRDTLSAEYRRANKLGGVPPGSILRLRV
jgi:hypothetical protein